MMERVLTWSGEIDFAARDALAEDAMRELAATGLTRLVVDLSDVTFIDSSGIAILLETRNQALDRGIAISLRGTPQQVEHVFKLSGLTGLFDRE